MGILPRAKHVEVTKGDSRQAINAVKEHAIFLTRMLGKGVGRKRILGHRLNLGQRFGVSIDR